MQNLILDFEEDLWNEFKPFADQSFASILSHRIIVLGNSIGYEEIKQKDSLIVELSRELCTRFQLKEAEVYVTNKNDESTLSTRAGNDYNFIFYHTRLLDSFNPDEIKLGLLHEFGHIIYHREIEPLDAINGISPTITQKKLAFILNHLSEYNADRFAVFASKDLDGFINFLRKINLLHKNIRENELKQTLTGDNSHPTLDNRIKALLCVKEFLGDDSFNINDHPDICKLLNEITGYNEYIENKSSCD